MHGIVRTSNPGSDSAAANGISRVQVRYSDGRVVNFLPDAGREAFSEDDILELKKVLDRASSAAEWSEVGSL